MREVAGVYLDRTTRRLTWRGEEVTLSPAAADAMLHLMTALEQRDLTPNKLIVLGDYTLDMQTGWLRARDGERCHFTRSCARLIGRLMASPGAVISAAKLRHCIYFDAEEAPDPHIIAVFLCGIRELLLVHNIKLKIETVRNHGMRIVYTQEPPA